MIRRSVRQLQSGAGHPYYYKGSAPSMPPSMGMGGGPSGPRSGGYGSGGGRGGISVGFDASRFILRPPTNLGCCIVPQGMTYVVERLGKYNRTLTPGVALLLPFLDRIRYAYSTKEQGLMIPQQTAFTRDNVAVDIDGVIFLRIVDCVKASYNIDNPIYNLINLAQTTMRSEIGRLPLDSLFEERHLLNRNIIEVIAAEAAEWGVECKRYEIRDIHVSEAVRQSMDFQAEAERRKRKLILESEGDAASEINRAEAKRRAAQLSADGQAYQKVALAKAEADAIEAVASATAKATARIASTMHTTPGAEAAVALRLAEQSISNMGKLAKETNTVVLSAPVGDPASLATQVFSVYNQITKHNHQVFSNNNKGDKSSGSDELDVPSEDALDAAASSSSSAAAAGGDNNTNMGAPDMMSGEGGSSAANNNMNNNESVLFSRETAERHSSVEHQQHHANHHADYHPHAERK